MVYMIEKGVPIPPRRKRKSKYNFDQMEVGDSIYIPNVKATTVSSAVSTAVRRKLKGWKFEVRSEGNGARVWRRL